ncbi:MAG: crossover junction endodeoxyribonuclease RuvC [Bacteroidia bacterium]|nr:crossover junction endodeoxyribonuclease RuvC [Bacteroidia bacterium]
MSNRIILGIDPGTNITGFGIIASNGKAYKVLATGVLSLTDIEDHHLKLKKIFERMLWLIENYKPDELAIEAPFFGKNVQSMLKLGRAQGVCMAAALYRQIPVFEYSPRKVKLAVTGRGSATKEQVAAMLVHIEGFIQPKTLDATDALAVAVCHCLQKNPEVTANNPLRKKRKSKSNWGDFATQNPERMITK